MADWKKFSGLYASLFRKLSIDEGLNYWKDFVEDAEWHILEKTLNSMEEDIADKRERGVSGVAAPKLGEIKRHYYKQKNRIIGKSNKMEQAEDCGTCKDGFLCVVSGPGRIILDSTLPPCPIRENEGIGVRYVACSCDAGNDANFKIGNQWDWHQRKECRKKAFVDDMKWSAHIKATRFIDECNRLYREQVKKEDKEEKEDKHEKRQPKTPKTKTMPNL